MEEHLKSFHEPSLELITTRDLKLSAQQRATASLAISLIRVHGSHSTEVVELEDLS